MKVIESDRVCFFDCDDTLILWNYKGTEPLRQVQINGRTFFVHHKHVQKIKDYSVMGFVNIIWSTSGHKWAETVCKALELSDYVTFCMSKPHRVFDDVKDLKDTIRHGYIELNPPKYSKQNGDIS